MAVSLDQEFHQQPPVVPLACNCSMDRAASVSCTTLSETDAIESIAQRLSEHYGITELPKAMIKRTPGPISGLPSMDTWTVKLIRADRAWVLVTEYPSEINGVSKRTPQPAKHIRKKKPRE